MSLQSPQSLQHLWNRLGKITTVEFSARSDPEVTGWNGNGAGIVTCEFESGNSLIFYESGHWTNQNNVKLTFSNSYRWSLNLDLGCIDLEHLRYGLHAPVPLLSIYQSSANHWKCESPHLCANDSYALAMTVHSQCIQVVWQITGPQKNTRLSYVYT